MAQSASFSDPSLLLLVGEQNLNGDSRNPSSSDEMDAKIELIDYMKQISLGLLKAPQHVQASIEAAILVCQEWKNRPRGKDVPLPPPSKLSERRVQVIADTSSPENLKNIAYTPCLSAPQSVLSMLGVKKENTQETVSSE